jgi:CheY-like chemotaxis protein
MSVVRDTRVVAGGEAVVVLCAEEAVRDVIAYWFSVLPVRTHVAADGYEANRLLKDLACRLLVTDRALPPWPGLDTFRQLRAANPQLHIAYVDNGSADGAILARLTGATTVLAKPLTREAVIEALPRAEPVI